MTDVFNVFVAFPQGVDRSRRLSGDASASHMSADQGRVWFP